MKKRLLITSIVMMLVVAVALSTATYAWFTSNANVTASSISLRADTSTATALGIGWTGGDAGTSISANISGTLAPMAPASLVTGTTTAAAMAFETETIKEVDSQRVFNGAGSTVYPVIYNNGSVQSFYLKNLSPQKSVNSITVRAIFGNDTETGVDESTAYSYNQKTTAITVGDAVFTKASLASNAGDTYTAHEVAADDFTATIADQKYALNTVYYELTETTYAVKTFTNPVVGETVVYGANIYTGPAFYTKDAAASKTADDMIRVAIFRKDAAAADGGNYHYRTSEGAYKLIGVLGTAETQYAEATELTAFDKNTTYYTKDEGVYTQVLANAEFDGDTTYYTATNTAVFGTITGDNAMKDLQHYKVSTQLQLIDGENYLAKLESMDLMVMVWLDGEVFDDTRAGNIGSVSLKFAA